MQFYQDIRFSEGLKGREKRIMRRLQAKRRVLPLFLIVLIEDGPDQLEILSTALLEQEYYKQIDYLVVGIADCQEDALGMVEELLQKVYDNTKTGDIKDYILTQRNVSDSE